VDNLDSSTKRTKSRCRAEKTEQKRFSVPPDRVVQAREKIEGLQRWVEQDRMNESLQGKEVIVVEGYCDLSQAGESLLGQKSCYGLR
jgi:hypothetical protein